MKKGGYCGNVIKFPFDKGGFKKGFLKRLKCQSNAEMKGVYVVCSVATPFFLVV